MWKWAILIFFNFLQKMPYVTSCFFLAKKMKFLRFAWYLGYGWSMTKQVYTHNMRLLSAPQREIFRSKDISFFLTQREIIHIFKRSYLLNGCEFFQFVDIFLFLSSNTISYVKMSNFDFFQFFAKNALCYIMLFFSEKNEISPICLIFGLWMEHDQTSVHT